MHGIERRGEHDDVRRLGEGADRLDSSLDPGPQKLLVDRAPTGLGQSIRRRHCSESLRDGCELRALTPSGVARCQDPALNLPIL